MSNRLRDLAGAYFHQDYEDDYPGPDAAVEAFRNHHTPDAVAELVSEIDAILSSPMSEPDVADLWIKRYLGSYDPVDRDGITYREWFAHVREILVRPQV